MLVVTGFSTGLFSDVRTGHVLMPILHWSFPGSDPATLVLVHHFVRKAAHLAVFGILVLLWHRALGNTPRGVVPAALAVTIVFAGLDEFHQSFTPGRTASVFDVGWDTAGATLALAARRLLFRT